MAYPNQLDVPYSEELTTVEIQTIRLEEYSRQAEAKRRCLEENRAVGYIWYPAQQ